MMNVTSWKLNQLVVSKIKTKHHEYSIHYQPHLDFQRQISRRKEDYTVPHLRDFFLPFDLYPQEFLTLILIKPYIMSTLTDVAHIRPRFSFHVAYPVTDVLLRVEKLKTKYEGKLVGTIADHHVILDIPVAERHYWSPQLNLRVEEDEDAPGMSTIKGLIGPRPAVWPLFMFIYFSIGVIGFFIGSYGISLWMLGTFSPWVLALPIAAVFMLSAYASSKYGESLGHDQAERLKDFIREALESPYQVIN